MHTATYQHMKRVLCAASVLLAIPVAASATTVSDDFNRPEAVPVQTPASNPNLIGTNYTIASGSWGVHASGYLHADSNGIMFENTLQTKNTEGQSFNLSANVLVGGTSTASRFSGLVFNYQNENDYYVLRATVNTSLSAGTQGVVQLNRVTNGTATVLDTVSGINLIVSNYFTFVINSSEAGVFSYSINDLAGTSLTGTREARDGSPNPLTDGYSGFYRMSGGAARFQDYELTVIPEPATATAIVLAASSLLLVALLRRRKKD